MFRLKEFLGSLTASSRTDHEFIWGYRGVISGDLAPNKCEIERGVFFAPGRD